MERARPFREETPGGARGAEPEGTAATVPVEARLLLWRRIWARLLAPPEGPEPGAAATEAGDGTTVEANDQEAA